MFEQLTILTDSLLRRLLARNKQQLEALFCLYGSQTASAATASAAAASASQPQRPLSTAASRRRSTDPRQQPREEQRRSLQVSPQSLDSPDSGSPAASPTSGLPSLQLLEAALVDSATKRALNEAAAGRKSDALQQPLRIRNPAEVDNYMQSWVDKFEEHRLLSYEERMQALGVTTRRAAPSPPPDLASLHPAVMRTKLAKEKDSKGGGGGSGGDSLRRHSLKSFPTVAPMSRAAGGVGARAVSESGYPLLHSAGSWSHQAPASARPKPRRHRSCSDLGNSASLPGIPRDLVRVIEVFKIEEEEPSEHPMPLRRRSSSTLRSSPLRNEVVMQQSPDVKRVQRTIRRDISPAADIKMPKPRVMYRRQRSQSSPLVAPAKLPHQGLLRVKEGNDDAPERPLQRSRFRSDTVRAW